MAQKVIWTQSALHDLDTVAQYIATGSEAYAAALVQKTLMAASSLSRLPRRGRTVPELGHHSIREVFVWSYRLIYTIQKKNVVILALIHAKRDLRQVWDK